MFLSSLTSLHFHKVSGMQPIHKPPSRSSLLGPQADTSTSLPKSMAAWSSDHILLSPVMRTKALWTLSSR